MGKIRPEMKKILFTVLLFVTCCLLFVPSPASAHMIGQPPYFKANGVFTDLYPVPTTSIGDFELPQDIAVGLFLINQSVEFEIDVNALPVPPEVVEKTKFLWEFGDGSKAEGLKNSHTYTKAGTYFLDIYADSEQGFEPQLLQSTAINILPSKDYKLPKAVIEVNGKKAKDPLLDIIDVNFNKEISFDGSKSEAGSSEIIEYFWDLGDMNSKTEVSFKYKYNENPYTVFPVLRVKTKDGFIADSFVQIKDENAFNEDSFLNTGMDWKMIALAVIASFILAAILTWLIFKVLFKKKPGRNESHPAF